MTIQQLEYIIALDTYRHFVTAADHCFVTQPTITIQVKKLEDEIGMIIFDRTQHPFIPTEQGKSFIQKAKLIIREVSDLKNMVNTTLESVIGSYKVAVIPTISPYLIPLIAKGFTVNYPDTILEIEEMESEYMLKALSRKEIDLGILVTPVEEPYIKETKLYNEPFVFYGSKDHKLSQLPNLKAKDIENLDDLWLLNEGHCFRNQVLSICQQQNQNTGNIQFRSGSIEAIKLMVDNYGGFTLIPEMAIDSRDNGIHIHFDNPKPIREVSIVSHYSFPKDGLITALRSEILKVIPKSFEKNRQHIKIKWR